MAKKKVKNSHNNNHNNNLKSIKKKYRIKPTIGDKAADTVTNFAGSWIFIIIFSITFIMWIIINIRLMMEPWDPYPFILLNLALSFLAAMQAPFILMSQNRATERDRKKAEMDFAINRKAEREIKEVQKELRYIKRKFTRKQ